MIKIIISPVLLWDPCGPALAKKHTLWYVFCSLFVEQYRIHNPSSFLKEMKEEVDQQLKTSSEVTITVPQLSDEDWSDDIKRGVAIKQWQRDVVQA